MADRRRIEKLRASYKDMSDDELKIKMAEYVPHSEIHLAAKLELDTRKRHTERELATRDTNFIPDSGWDGIKADYEITKRGFGKKINFIKEKHIRKAIFRDIEQAHILSKYGFAKPAVILAGGIIEEFLRQYLISKNVTPMSQTFNGYIEACETNNLLRTGISKLSHSVRHFRNLVHLREEKSAKFTLTKSAAIGAVSYIFTIVNDF